MEGFAMGRRRRRKEKQDSNGWNEDVGTETGREGEGYVVKMTALYHDHSHTRLTADPRNSAE